MLLKLHPLRMEVLEDFEEGIVYTNTTMSELTYYNYKGTLKPVAEKSL